MNVLYVTPYVPSRIRTRPYHLIRALTRLGHRVTLLTAAGTGAEEEIQARQLAQSGIAVQFFPVSLRRSLGNCLRALPTREPFQAAYAYHPGMERRLAQLLREEAFDVVHVEHLRAARLARALDDTPSVYDSVDCISLLFEQTMRTSPEWRARLKALVDLGRTRRYEARLLARFDRVVITSQRDRQALEQLAERYLPSGTRRAPITVVTNGVDLDYFRPWEGAGRRDGKTVIFTGKMSYHANVASVLYFVREVLPLIWDSDPEVRFYVVGKDPPEAVRRLGSDRRVVVTGVVDDLRPYLARVTLAVCPALYAVGIQNKVLEAMAMGTPVVSTPAGCAALASEEGREILVADGARQMTLAVLQVLTDPDLARQLSAAGRRYVEQQHDWEDSAQRLAEVYRQALAGRTGRSP
jgi:sugar transferase (PEP-CTERM/EpsH1 system associated)